MREREKLPKEVEKFFQEVKAQVEKQGMDLNLKKLAIEFIKESAKYKYSYNFT